MTQKECQRMFTEIVPQLRSTAASTEASINA